jgi:tRNA threonylcarbamoyl adenosine modification protein YeaZ
VTTLAIETSTARGSVALLDREITFARGELFPALQKLAPGKLDLILVGVGPGSFTGIRVGIAAAKGLALPGQVPVKAVSSFDALALTAVPRMPRDCVQMCVLGDARRDEVYWALYDREGRRLRDCQIGALESIGDELHNPMWFISAEIEQFRHAIREAFGGFASICETPVFPSAAVFGRVAQTDWPLEPIYLRAAEYKKI